MTVEAYVVRGVYVRLRPSLMMHGEFIAMAKRAPFVKAGVQLLGEPGPVWIKFGEDKAALIDEVVAEALAAR